MTRALTAGTGPARALPPNHPRGVGAGLKPALPVAVASKRPRAPVEEPALSSPKGPALSLPKGVSHSASFVSHFALLVSHSASLVSPAVSQAKAE